MKLVDIVDALYRELENPTDISIAAIHFWMESNLGNLNIAVNTDYSFNTSTRQINDNGGNEISNLEDIAIYKQLYKVHRAKVLVRRHLGAASTESIIQIDSDGSSIRKVNKTTLAAEYRQLLKNEEDTLDNLVKNYGHNSTLPLQVVGDDTVAAYEDVLDPNPRIR